MSETKKIQRKSNQQGGLSRQLRILLMIGIPVIVIMVIGLSLSNANTPATLDGDTALLIREDSPTLGPIDAQVTIVEFLDPECESCRAAFPAVKQLLKDYGDNVRLVVRYLPLHNNSVLAATATEAAGLQGKYWEMQEELFTHQSEWGEQQTPQTDLFIGYAEEIGLDIDQFVNDLDNADILAKIERDRADAQALKLTGTPTFFINGELVEPLNLERIIEMIEAALG
ncbi:MAG: thioredoxin domain-containing protein [bacterium]|nr:thioredoxin domain-containing protein [bacterium]